MPDEATGIRAMISRLEKVDEFGVPRGEHTLTCGCAMRGRGLVTPCEDHAAWALSDLGDYSVE